MNFKNLHKFKFTWILNSTHVMKSTTLDLRSAVWIQFTFIARPNTSHDEKETKLKSTNSSQGYPGRRFASDFWTKERLFQLYTNSSSHVIQLFRVWILSILLTSQTFNCLLVKVYRKYSGTETKTICAAIHDHWVSFTRISSWRS